MTTFTNDLARATLSTSTPPRGRRTARTAGAVFAGLFIIFAITTATDVLLHVTNVYPAMGESMSDALYLLAAAYRVVYGILGCYVTARLAPSRPLAHALGLGVVGTLIGTAGAIAMWEVGPAWYPLAVIAMALPCGWVGGKLDLARRAHG